MQLSKENKMTKILFAFISILLISTHAFAQNEKSSEKAELKSLHGGLVKKINNAFLEVVQEKEHTSIYITGRDHKNITDKKLSLSAIAKINGKDYPMQLSFENDHYSTRPANSYLHKENNYVLMLTISFPGSKEKVNFDLKGK